VVGRRATNAQQRIAIRPADKTVEQAVSMQMAAFLSAKKEPDSAEAMDSGPHSGHFGCSHFKGAKGAQTSRMKESRRSE
jgi:hypothetical protein